jgi:hypothetical protein
VEAYRVARCVKDPTMCRQSANRWQQVCQPCALYKLFQKMRVISWLAMRLLPCQSQSQSYFAIDSLWVSTSWCQAQSGTYDQMLFSFRSLMSEVFCVSLFWAPSLTRGWVCHLSVYVCPKHAGNFLTGYAAVTLSGRTRWHGNRKDGERGPIRILRKVHYVDKSCVM